jgi:GNAT superfamily N-acetyltransferase
MKPIAIRKTELMDAPDIAHLVCQLGYPVSPEEMVERLRAILAHPEYVTFVAEAQGRAIGLVGAYVSLGIELTGMYGRLTGLVVDEQWRGQGIGKSLMVTLEDFLKDRGARSLILTSGKHRMEAHLFYEHLGYEETGVRFVKYL